jgi:hypothetical protein
MAVMVPHLLLPEPRSLTQAAAQAQVLQTARLARAAAEAQVETARQIRAVVVGETGVQEVQAL